MHLTKSEYYELPNKYNQTVVRLLMQSPKCIFAYWDISDDIINNYSSYNSFIKIINITKNYSYEVPIDPYTNNYYIKIEDTNCNYQVELIRKLNNKYINLYTSNTLTVPSNVPQTNYYTEEVIFKNYLCIADTNKIKIYTPKHFTNQNHTDFENISSSDRYIN